MNLLVPLLCLTLGDGLQLSPSNGNDVTSVLQQLAALQPAAWCEGCATVLTARVSGSLARGELTVDMSVSVGGTAPAYVELLGANRSLGWDSMVANGRVVPLFWSGRAYSAVLAPGDVSLHATARFAPGPINLTLPGPVGHVTFAVPDADVLGNGKDRAVQQGSYQLSPSLALPKRLTPQRLRLQVTRSFDISRDKRFEVTVQARGATPGQVIALPLLPGEQVEDLPLEVAHVAGDGNNRRIDWVAEEGAPALHYAGKWTAEGIELNAGNGTTRETWTVRCDDPFQCNFTGDAEPWVGHTGHSWEPQGGQHLHVQVEALRPHGAMHTVAQMVHVVTQPTGRSLRQRMWVRWQSSADSLVAVTLPVGAMPNQFQLDDHTVPLLRDSEGGLQISVPQGASTLYAEWQLPDHGREFLGAAWLRPPVPDLSEAVGTLIQQIELAPGRAPLLAGGLPGSPRVELWPNIGVVLALGLATARLFRRFKVPLAAPRLWWLGCLGFAVRWPAAVLPLVVCLGVGRWLGSVRGPRRRLLLVVELGVWALLVVGALSMAVGTLEQVMFEAQPLSHTSYVSAPSHPQLDTGDGQTLTWGCYLAGMAEPDGLPATWALSVPVAALRLLWAAWAVVLALLLMAEGRLAVQQLAAYWSAATAGRS